MNTPGTPSAAHETPIWRALAPADLAAMHALHLLSIQGLPAQVVKQESAEFFASLLGGRGRVTGGWVQDKLIAYGVLQNDLLAHDNPRAALGLAPDAPLLKLAGAAVDPAWRQRGLQRLLIERRMAMAGTANLFSTAAPGNASSWHNLLACGFAVRALEYRYGGHARYLLAYVPSQVQPPATAPMQELALSDLERQHALLEQGWWGVAPGQAPGSLLLRNLLPGP